MFFLANLPGTGLGLSGTLAFLEIVISTAGLTAILARSRSRKGSLV